MKKTVILTLILLSFTLTGCNTSNSQSENSNFKSSDKNLNTEKVKNSSSNPIDTQSDKKIKDDNQSSESLWNKQKSQQLNSFVVNWGQTLNQVYEQYSPNKNVDLYGLQLPDAVLKNDIGWQVVIGNTPIVLNWSENGEADNGYALVAVYSDAETQPYMEKHVYFFTIVAGIPKVLVTSQNQGNGNNYLYFTETENIELREGFSNILGSTIDIKKGQELFTKDEKMSYFASGYEILPYAGKLVYEDSGITYRIEEPINNTQSAILEAIKSIEQMSSDIQEQIGEAIPIRLQELNESSYSITIVDGKAIQANQLFGRIIKGMD